MSVLAEIINTISEANQRLIVAYGTPGEQPNQYAIGNQNINRALLLIRLACELIAEVGEPPERKLVQPVTLMPKLRPGLAGGGNGVPGAQR